MSAGRPRAATSVWAACAITPDEDLSRVRVHIDEGRIAGIESNVSPRARDDRYRDATLVPGLIDLQVNGGDGAAYSDPDPQARERATAFHLRSGTTSLLATVVTAPVDEIRAALSRLADEVSEAGPLVGIHLEGPFLSEEKTGAHSAADLRDPDPATVDRLIAAARGALRLVTLAPERAGALEAIERFRAAGVVVAAGHSRATLARLRAAVDRGLCFMTHVGNASDWPDRPVDPELGFRVSEPGMVGTFLIEPRIRGSVILDGRHLHPELAAALVRLRGPHAVALVSDATHAAGLPPGRYSGGGLDLTVHPEGYATAGQGLAGAVTPLIHSVRVATREAGLPLADAVRMATQTPAEVVGIEERKGALREGADADLVVLDRDLAVCAVYRAGRPVVQVSSPPA